VAFSLKFFQSRNFRSLPPFELVGLRYFFIPPPPPFDSAPTPPPRREFFGSTRPSCLILLRRISELFISILRLPSGRFGIVFYFVPFVQSALFSLLVFLLKFSLLTQFVLRFDSFALIESSIQARRIPALSGSSVYFLPDLLPPYPTLQGIQI